MKSICLGFWLETDTWNRDRNGNYEGRTTYYVWGNDDVNLVFQFA